MSIIRQSLRTLHVAPVVGLAAEAKVAHQAIRRQDEPKDDAHVQEVLQAVVDALRQRRQPGLVLEVLEHAQRQEQQLRHREGGLGGASKAYGRNSNALSSQAREKGRMGACSC